MLQDVSGRGAWSRKCFKMSLQEMLQGVSGRGTRNASRCLWQRHLEQEMLQEVSGRGTWSKKCFKMSLAEGRGERHLEAFLAPSPSAKDIGPPPEASPFLAPSPSARDILKHFLQRHLEAFLAPSASARDILKHFLFLCQRHLEAFLAETSGS